MINYFFEDLCREKVNLGEENNKNVEKKSFKMMI